jgi:sigma-E factor negative regulatory protein RseA
MNKISNQTISQFLDNDLDTDDALDLLQDMHKNPNLAETLSRYEAVSHALKTQEYIAIRPDFLSGISAQLENEPSYFLPARKAKPKLAFAYNQKVLALAASVAMVAVLLVYGGKQLAQINQPAAMQTAKVQVEDPYPLNKRINAYLQAHNNSVYTYGETNLAHVTYHQQQ